MERILFRLFDLFYKVPLIRLFIEATDKKLTKIYPYDSFGRKVNAGKSFLLQFFALFASFFAGLIIMFFGKFRLGYVIADLMVAALFFKLSGFVLFEKARHTFFCEMIDFIGELRHAYFRSSDALEAVYEAWESAGEIMRLHLAAMEKYFESEEIPEEYLIYAPDAFILSLLAILRNVIKYGDAAVNGHSSFLTNLEELESDIFEKRLEIEKDKAITRGTFFFVCLPVMFLPLMEKWGVAQIEELAEFFNGASGGVVRILTGLVTLVVARMFFIMRGSVDTDLPYKPLKKIKYHEGKVARYTAALLENNFPGKSLQDFYESRIVSALFVLAIGVVFMAIYGFGIIRAAVILAASYGASFYPYMEIALEGSLLNVKLKEEIATYRRLLLMLSAVPGIGAFEILEELYRYGFYFKNEIGICLDRLNDNDDLAFDALKVRGNKELYRIADDFYAIDKVGLKESFHDIPEQNLFYGKKRKQDMEIMQGIKKNILEVLLYVPFTASVFMYLIIPFMYESIKSLGSFMDMTGAL